jgi:hypothetical protein
VEGPVHLGLGRVGLVERVEVRAYYGNQPIQRLGGQYPLRQIASMLLEGLLEHSTIGPDGKRWYIWDRRIRELLLSGRKRFVKRGMEFLNA